jgi:two-component system heavy metal sensor histidine kinase CusS
MRRPWPDSITVRTSLLFTLLAAAVFLAMGLLIRNSVSRHFEELDRDQLEGKLVLIRHILAEAPGNGARMTPRLADALVGHPDLSVRISTQDGNPFFASGPAAMPATLLQQATSSTEATAIYNWREDNGMAYRGLATRLELPASAASYRIAVAVDTHHHQEFLATFERELGLTGLLGLTLMGLLGWFAARRGLRPVQTMAQVAEGITAQRLQQRLDLAAVPTELLPLAASFNAMLARLADSVERLSGFSSDLAHELRTPISNLMTQTQVALSKPRAAEEYRDILHSNLEEFERLARMITDMLFLAKADHGLVVPHQERVDLRREVEALFEFYEAVAAEKAVQLMVEGAGVVHGDRLMLQRALGNMLSNAIRHSTGGEKVSITLHQQASQLSIAVKNQGDLIAAEHLPRLFDRFYRADAARQRRDEGVGLGLAITRSIVQAHKGTVEVTSHEGRTVFTLVLPVGPSA